MSDSPVTVSSPLAPEDLLFGAMTVQQGLSTIDEIELNLLSEKADLLAEDLLGKPLDVALLLRDGEQRHLGGLVTRFGIGAPQGRFFGYQASVRPWLWFLTRTSDCKIFQEMSTPEIVKAVFDDHAAIAKYSLSLSRSYRKRVYCVQYRESDYSFVARLLEDEGIYWYFKHGEGGPELVLVDDVQALPPLAGNPTLPYYPRTGQAPPDVDHVDHWTFSRAVHTGKSVLSSYDFERPGTSLRVSGALVRPHELADLEQFDYQGDYVQRADGEQLNTTRLDEQQTRHERLSGSTNAPAMAAGGLFTLSQHPRGDQNIQYLCVQARLSAQVRSVEAGSAAAGLQCSFNAVPASQVFRPARRTPKPFVQGPQTAVVVGPAGEELYTDQYGRVKVQFHWDRYGQKNDKSSCWVRVSSPWAGQSFGFVQVPRIGQEVVVDFLEGDPDQPIITGRVYNADQMPPWQLPANATQSGVLTRSSKGGAYGNANALRFEDKQGAEQVWLHAEKNQDIEVENDETHWVGHDRRKTVDHDETVHVKHDRTETVDNNETITIGVDRSLTVKHDETETIGHDRHIKVGSNHTELIGSAMSLTVGSTLTESVAINHAHNVGGALEITVGGAIAITAGAALAETVGGIKTESVGASSSEEVGANKSVQVGGNLDEAVKGNVALAFGKNLSQTVADDASVSITKVYHLTAKKVQIVADDEISLKAGDAELVMKKNGDITIRGKKINVDASGDLVMRGSKIKEN